MAVIRRKLKAVSDGDRQMVSILSCVAADGIAAVEAACKEALDQGVFSAPVVINILARSRDLSPAPLLLTPATLRLTHEPVAALRRLKAIAYRPMDCARYDSLRRASPYGTHPFASGSRTDGEPLARLDLMGTLKLYGMRSAYDEVMASGIKRQHEPPRIVGDLLQSEIAEKQARSIRYQLTIAKLPLAKDLDDFDFTGTPINAGLVRDLATGLFVADQRNVVLVGGTGTGKSHLAIAIARALIRNGTRGRFYNVVDLVNRLETETRSGKQGRLADYLNRLDFIILDELGYLPFAQAGGQLLFHLISKLYERTSIIVTTNPPSANGPPSSAMQR